MKNFCDICLLDLSTRPLHRRGSLCTVHLVETWHAASLQRPSKTFLPFSLSCGECARRAGEVVERGRGRGQKIIFNS